MPGQGWPKEARLRRRREFLEVQGRGFKVSSQWITGLAKRNALKRRRLGVTVSNKVGNAVVRSRVKRWIREAFRRHREHLPNGIDLVLVARPGADGAGYRAVVQDFERICRTLRQKFPGG